MTMGTYNTPSATCERKLVVAAAVIVRTASAFSASWSIICEVCIWALTSRSAPFTIPLISDVRIDMDAIMPFLASHSKLKNISSMNSSSIPSCSTPVAERRMKETRSVSIVQIPCILARSTSSPACSRRPTEHIGRSRFTTVPMHLAIVHCCAAKHARCTPETRHPVQSSTSQRCMIFV